MKYTDLLQEVLPRLPGCGVDLASFHIKQAVIDLCRRSLVWKHWPDPQDIDAGEPEYGIELPPGADIAQVMLVRVDGVTDPLTPLDMDQVEAQFPAWRTDQGVVSAYFQPEPSKVHLLLTPDETISNGLSMVLAVQPKMASTIFPDWLYSQFGQRIADGALSRLLDIPRKPWSDAVTAARHKREFDNACAAATNAAARGLSRAPTRTTSIH
jgi:hypothetical protein